MKYKNLIISAFILIAVVALSSSCKKSSSSVSVHDALIGTWKVKAVARDTNKNNVLDANEIFDTVYYPNQFVTFKTDGSGTMLQNGVAQPPFTWSLSSDDKYMNVIDSGSTSAMHIYLISFSSTDMIVRDTSDQSTSGGYPILEHMVKQ